MAEKKTLGQAIDEIISALTALDAGSQLTAIRAACEHLNLAPAVSQTRPGDRGENTEPSSSPLDPPKAAPVQGHGLPPSTGIQDIRTFKDQKKPASAIEMACVVAYFLDSLAAPADQKKELSSADMEKYFKQAGYRLPARMAQVLVNAKSSGYFDSAGYGKYKLNPVGHNLVVHGLPKDKGK